MNRKAGFSGDRPPAATDGDRLWVTWKRQVRNQSMARLLGATLLEMTGAGGRLRRYLALGPRTYRAMMRFPGRTIFVMDPSVILVLIGLLACRLGGKRLVIDAHSAALEPFGFWGPFVKPIARFVVASADFVIVTNEGSAALARKMGGRPLVVPDPLPELPGGEERVPQIRHGALNVLFICTWADDEPFRDVMTAAESLGAAFHLIFTGRYQKVGIDPAMVPANVTLAGFLDDHAYHALLKASDIVMDLTTRDNCLVCGAYETVAAARPGIISDWGVNRAYFDRGFVYARNDAAGIAQALRKAAADHARLSAEIVDLREDLRARDQRHAHLVDQALATLSAL